MGREEDKEAEGGRVLARRASGLQEDDSRIGAKGRRRTMGEEGVARGPSGGWGERKFTEAICC